MPDRDYRTLLLLRAARETGIVDALVTSATTVDEVAEETGVTRRAARITVDALVDAGFLEPLEEGLEPTNKMLGFITKTDVRSIGSVPHELDRLERWFDLPETMRSGEPPTKPPNWTRNRLGAMAAMDESTIRAFVTAAVHEHPDVERVLDVRGGAGSYAREFARRGYVVTLVEAPEVVEVDEPLLQHESVDLVPTESVTDLPATDDEEGYDLVFCARVARAHAAATNRSLLAAAYDVLAPGGTVVFIDALRDQAADASLVAAEMLAQTDEGDVYGEQAFGEWFGDAGFERLRTAEVPGTDHQLVAGDKPA